MSNCHCCFTDFLAVCPNEIRVYAQLQPTTMYTWVITDKFGKQWSDEFTTDVNGFFTIAVTDLPAGLLTEFSGHFKLTILDQDCKPIKFKIASEYDCIDFHMVGGTRVKDNLGCTFDSVFQGQPFASFNTETFAEAEALATGNQFRYFLVENDEDKTESNTSYVYVPGFVGLIYLGAAVPNAET